MTAFRQPVRAPTVQPTTLADPPLLTGRVLIEVVAPAQPSAAALPGWTLRVWPQARLGDLTLEAVPERSATLRELLDGLRALGFTPLGHRVWD